MRRNILRFKDKNHFASSVDWLVEKEENEKEGDDKIEEREDKCG